jgi:hypothetical protein
MKTLTRLIVAAAVAASGWLQTVQVQAGLITGSIGFTGSVNLDTSSPGTATLVTWWITPTVTTTSGTFAPIASGAPMTFRAISWVFNTSTKAPITNFWTVGGFKFELVSSQITIQAGNAGANAYVEVDGTGVVSGNGCTPTAFTWSFTCQNPPTGSNPDSWTFTASCASQNCLGGPVIQSQVSTDTAVLQWTDPTFTLQAAPALNAAYTNIPGATSPYTNSFTGRQQFFRLQQ